MTEYKISCELLDKLDENAQLEGFYQTAEVAFVCDGDLGYNENTLVFRELDEEGSHKFGMLLLEDIFSVQVEKHQADKLKKFFQKYGVKIEYDED